MMADVRALLRQQRAARRIEHPHAAYSDAGKLLCVVCHEHIKTESLWDGHVQGAGHRQRLHQAAAMVGSKEIGAGDENRNSNRTQSHKRKLDEDEEMTDQIAEEEAVRRKRSKPDMALLEQPKQDDNKMSNNVKPLTPPLTRRQSNTPTLGVEMQIPSRPATPVAIREGFSNSTSASGTSAATTPKTVPVGRSPLIPQDASAAQLPPQTNSTAQRQASATVAPATSAASIDDVWAAFEADLVHGPAGNSTKPPPVAGFADGDAVISAPAMTAAEVAAKSEEEEQAKRRALVDMQIEDEREDATRALETEFEVMEELEARARKLRERREALRLQGGAESGPLGVAAASGGAGIGKAAAVGKENAVAGAGMDDEEDDEDEETEDDWVGFRFRT